MLIERKLGLLLSHLKTIYFRITVKPGDDFNSNITYRIIWDRREILKTINDKVKALAYVKSLVPNIKHPHRYFETESFDKINWTSLPEEFVCKVSHGSGGAILVHKNAPKTNTLPNSVRKFGWKRLELLPINFDQVKAKKIFKNLMKSTYSQSLGRRKPEWGYWHPEPNLIVEEYLSLKGERPKKITCSVIDGAIKIIFVDQQLFSETEEVRSVVRYTPSTGIKPFAKELQVSEASVKELIRNSIALAINYEYLRVDWLLADGGFYFNELTPYPGGGNLIRNQNPDYFFLSNMWRPKKSDYR